MQEPYDCLSCGACCTSSSDGFVDVRPADLLRMTPRTRSRFVVGERAPSLRMARGACAALRVKRNHHFCQIYTERPEACRSVEVGGRECENARRRRGLGRTP